MVQDGPIFCSFSDYMLSDFSPLFKVDNKTEYVALPTEKAVDYSKPMGPPKYTEETVKVPRVGTIDYSKPIGPPKYS